VRVSEELQCRLGMPGGATNIGVLHQSFFIATDVAVQQRAVFSQHFGFCAILFQFCTACFFV